MFDKKISTSISEREKIEHNDLDILGENRKHSMSIVAILLSTFNGEKFIEEQLISICSQDFHDWTLYVRDDCSSDETLTILKRYSKADNRIIIIEDKNLVNLGPCRSYMLLLEHSYNCGSHKIFSFCDQDDVWEKNKLSEFISAYDLLSGKEKKLPLGVYSGFILIDSNSNIIKMESNSLPIPNDVYDSRNFGNQMFSNFFFGFALAINREAARIAIQRCYNLAMHDWWVVIVILAFGGKILMVDKALTRYRQHPLNVIGYVNKSALHILKFAIKRIRRKISYWPLINNQLSLVIELLNETGFMKPEMLLRYEALCRTSPFTFSRLAAIIKMRSVFSFCVIDIFNVILLFSSKLSLF